MQIEFHFQEGFTGQGVSITSQGAVLADVTARTRLMTGLAEIVPLDLQHGEEVTLSVGGDPAKTMPVSIDTATPFVTINMEENGLQVSQTDRRPGYL
ncbi:MAG: hypothetical protein HLUCCA08_05245 [Rhodobacteraceae bacterium HLUCCA08]|nr:MAG: hypothetical protein HLUCCA08_05245 [Rhodobacteraceae bacterium HLUCCA08]